MSLPYFKEFGWQAEVVTVQPAYTDFPIDEMLSRSIPTDTTLHYVKALNQNITAKFGLGSVALRSLFYYRTKVNQLLAKETFDLIYFSTTQFPVCALGPYWKKKFKIPFVIDMQDPWYSDYYKGRPKNERPPKHWFSSRLNRLLEAMTMKKVDGLISVSEKYIDTLQERYPNTIDAPAAVITFGAFGPDTQIAAKHTEHLRDILIPGFKNIVYVGRGGTDMHAALTPLFKALASGIKSQPDLFRKLRLYFIGTSYAPAGKGIPTISPLADKYGVSGSVIEITDRISYFHTLKTLLQADALFIPGSDDVSYTASKIFPYLTTNKPLLAIVHPQSPIPRVFHDYGLKTCYSYTKPAIATKESLDFMTRILKEEVAVVTYNGEGSEKYTARNMARSQVTLFNRVIERLSKA